MESDDAAVLIGVSSSRDPSLLDVPAARNSLHAMYRLLTSPELCGWSEDQVDDLSVVAPERLVLQHLHAQGRSPLWNNSGFGNNDAGRARDSHPRGGDHFDVLHPIDLSWPVHIHAPAIEVTAHEMAAQLRAQLPYVFRTEARDAELGRVQLTLPESSLRADRAFRLLAAALGDSWQISALVGQVLMYREQGKRYPNAIRYYAGTQTVTEMPEVCVDAGLPDGS
jgi:hypothetical protein